MKWKIENLIPKHCSANQALSSDMHIVVLGRIVWPFFSIMCKKTRFSEKRYESPITYLFTQYVGVVVVLLL